MKNESKNFKVKDERGQSKLCHLRWEDTQRAERGLKNSRCVLQNRQKAAFTLAEVVITLIVIGVVAAVTIPMLNNDVNDKKWNVARQKAQATIGEAFKLATINGYVTPDYDNSKDFVTKVLTKYLKINKQCDTAVDCGFSSSVKRPDGKSSRAIPTSWTDSTRAHVNSGGNNSWSYAAYNTVDGGIRAKFNNSTFFQTLDGFSVAFFFNPYCLYDEKDRYRTTEVHNGVTYYHHFSLDVACMNAVYDMNGKQGPNRVGQDIGFVGSFWNGFNVKAVSVLPYKAPKLSDNNMPGTGNNKWLRARQYCNELHDNDWKMPDLDEMSLIYLNHYITHASTYVDRFFTSVPYANSGNARAWNVMICDNSYITYAGYRNADYNTNGSLIFYVHCVRTN